MYMVRKRFMYWHIPATTEVRLDPRGEGVYCFVPAKLVKVANVVMKYIPLVDYDPVAKTLRDRMVALPAS